MLKHGKYFDRCALFLLNDEKTHLELYASIDLTPQQKNMATYKIGEGATGLAAKSAEPIVIENIHNNINYLNKMGALSTSVISYVAVPIIQKDGVVGVVWGATHPSVNVAVNPSTLPSESTANTSLPSLS